MVASRALLAGALARRGLLRIAGLAAVASLAPRAAAAQVFTGSSISQAASPAGRMRVSMPLSASRGPRSP